MPCFDENDATPTCVRVAETLTDGREFGPATPHRCEGCVSGEVRRRFRHHVARSHDHSHDPKTQFAALRRTLVIASAFGSLLGDNARQIHPRADTELVEDLTQMEVDGVG